MKLTKGMTFIELMVTMGIIVILAGIAMPAYQGYIQTSHRAECNNEIGAIKLAQEEFFLENNAYFPPVGSSAGVLAIQTASTNLYVSGYTVAGNSGQTNTNIAAAMCSYTVVASTAGPGYTITAVGQNELSGIPDIVFTK